MFFDLALNYDPENVACDLSLGVDGDLMLDETPITALLLSVELDRRAAVDDILPDGKDAFSLQNNNQSLNARRGSVLDILDESNSQIGSRCWLLSRAKQSSETRLLFQMWLEEAVAWVLLETGKAATISVDWLRPQVLRYRVVVENNTLANIANINSGVV